MSNNQKIKQIKIGDNTYDIEPKNSEVLASSHITGALGYTPANSATTVTHTASTAVGSATKPVYVALNGAATACTYSLNTDVPSEAVFTDHITTVASSGTGNFVTGMTASNGNITYTKGTALTASDIANNVTTATSGKVLDAYQGKVLNDKIAAIESRGRYLSIWDASTGKPNDLPGGGSSTTEVYTYKTGDYFIVKAAGNKVPSGTSIPAGTTIATFPSTTGDSSDINDTIYFNGTTWSVLHVPAGTGDVTGPSGSVGDHLAAFDGTTGKVIKDSGISISTVDAKIENVQIGSIQGTVSNHISNFEAQAAGNLAIKDTVSASDLASDVTALINSKQAANTAVTHAASTAVGSATKPVYIASNGAATACTYSLNKDVPSTAVFTDTHYTNTLTIQGNGTDAVVFNQASNKTLNIKCSGATTVAKTADGEITISSTDNDTKNTAGATNTSSKIYLVGAPSQTANPQTYTHNTVYVDTEGKLYSNGKRVLESTGDTMTGRLKYTESTEPVTSLTAGKWYHLHVPAGTTSITSADGKIYISGKIKNIVTTLTATAMVYENVIGWTSSAYPTGFVCFSGEVGSSYVGYNLSNAAADFDCDFCYSSSTGTITNLLPFITNFVDNYALVSEIPTLKLNGTATTGSFYAPTSAISTTTATRYLVGTSSTTSVATENTNASCYMSNGYLYSNNKQVLTDHQDISGKVSKSGDTMNGSLTMYDANIYFSGSDCPGLCFDGSTDNQIWYDPSTSKFGLWTNDASPIYLSSSGIELETTHLSLLGGYNGYDSVYMHSDENSTPGQYNTWLTSGDGSWTQSLMFGYTRSGSESYQYSINWNVYGEFYIYNQGKGHRELDIESGSIYGWNGSSQITSYLTSNGKISSSTFGYSQFCTVYGRPSSSTNYINVYESTSSSSTTGGTLVAVAQGGYYSTSAVGDCQVTFRIRPGYYYYVSFSGLKYYSSTSASSAGVSIRRWADI